LPAALRADAAKRANDIKEPDNMMTIPNEEAIQAEIAQEIAENKILIYGKGTKEMPMCGFTVETIEFFNKYGHPFAVINVLDNPAKRAVLSKMTDWPTLPKVFIGGEFYADTDVLDEMESKGEVKPLLDKVFGA
jgi:monothiol glutaredoxin